MWSYHRLHLEVTGSTLNGTVSQLLVPLATTRIATIEASNCELLGEIPSLDWKASGASRCWYQSTHLCRLEQYLQVLDLSQNRIESVSSLPASLRIDISGNKVPLSISSTVLKKAITHEVDMWLTGTELQNRHEVDDLLDDELKLQKDWVPRSESHACRQLVTPLLRVTPEKFLPEYMCGCRPGYKGSGVMCTPCGENNFNTETRTLCVADFVCFQIDPS